jgi:hypothetical protein
LDDVVLDGLEAADDFTELFAFADIVDGHVDHLLKPGRSG